MLRLRAESRLAHSSSLEWRRRRGQRNCTTSSAAATPAGKQRNWDLLTVVPCVRRLRSRAAHARRTSRARPRRRCLPVPDMLRRGRVRTLDRVLPLLLQRVHRRHVAGNHGGALRRGPRGRARARLRLLFVRKKEGQHIPPRPARRLASSRRIVRSVARTLRTVSQR